MDSLPGKWRHSIKSLLLLVNLFVARTLGNCPKPELEENIILTDEALLMNDFPDNVEISLTCANGYIKDSGTETMRCVDGAWSNLSLKCKKKDCGAPLPQPHMTFDLSQGTLFGAVAIVNCDKGYLITGSSYKHCYNAGWTGKSSKCQIVTCAKPEKIANGLNSWDSEDSPKYGDNVQFSCNEGYTLNGTQSIMCTENGVYDFPSPQCLSVTKEGLFTTKLVTTQTSVPTIPTQETSTTTTTSASTTGSGHRDSTLTARASPTVSLSVQGTTVHLHGPSYGVKHWMMGSLHVLESTPGWTSTTHLEQTCCNDHLVLFRWSYYNDYITTNDGIFFSRSKWRHC